MAVVVVVVVVESDSETKSSSGCSSHCWLGRRHHIVAVPLAKPATKPTCCPLELTTTSTAVTIAQGEEEEERSV